MKIALTVLFCLAFLGPMGVLRAGDAEQGFTYEFGADAPKQTLPSWMTGQPVASPGAHSTISFPITPPAGDSELAVTFYFTESTGGFLRVYWASPKNSGMLSDNLYEGIAMPNQRTLLIKRDTLTSAGTLNVQSSDPSLNLSRIHWEWVDPATLPVANASKGAALIDSTGAVHDDGEVNGAPPLPKQDQMGDSVVTATLTDKPERIEAGVDFVASLEQAPQFAHLEVQMAGVPVGKSVKLWVNNAQAGEVALAVPDLNDPGYAASGTNGAPSYIGWRKGAVYFPAELLKAGENHFQFTVQDAAAGAPVAVKDLTLQLKYGAKPAVDAQSASPSPTPAAEQAPQQQPAQPDPDASQVPLPDLQKLPPQGASPGAATGS